MRAITFFVHTLLKHRYPLIPPKIFVDPSPHFQPGSPSNNKLPVPKTTTNISSHIFLSHLSLFWQCWHKIVINLRIIVGKWKDHLNSASSKESGALRGCLKKGLLISSLVWQADKKDRQAVNQDSLKLKQPMSMLNSDWNGIFPYRHCNLFFALHSFPIIHFPHCGYTLTKIVELIRRILRICTARYLLNEPGRQNIPIDDPALVTKCSIMTFIGKRCVFLGVLTRVWIPKRDKSLIIPCMFQLLCQSIWSNHPQSSHPFCVNYSTSSLKDVRYSYKDSLSRQWVSEGLFTNPPESRYD